MKRALKAMIVNDWCRSLRSRSAALIVVGLLGGIVALAGWSYLGFIRPAAANLRAFSCLSWISASLAVDRIPIDEKDVQSMIPSSHPVWGERFTEDNQYELLLLIGRKDARAVAELELDLVRRKSGSSHRLYLHVGVWAVFHVKRERASEFLCQMMQHDDQRAVCARRCLERLLMQCGAVPDSQTFTSKWFKEESRLCDEPFLQELERRSGEKRSSSVSEVPITVLKDAWNPKAMESANTYQLGPLPNLTKETLFQMRLAEILWDRGVTETEPYGSIPAGFPFGYPDRSWCSAYDAIFHQMRERDKSDLTKRMHRLDDKSRQAVFVQQ